MRTTTTPWTVALCTVAALALTAGCTKPGPDPTASASWDEHVKALEDDKEAQAIKAAEQAVRDYYKVRDQCLADPPNTEPSCFDEVSMDNQLEVDRYSLEGMQEEGLRAVGKIEVVGTDRVVDVQLPPTGSKEITLSICMDTAGIDVLGPDGTSVLPGGDERGRLLFVVRKHADKWKVADLLDDPEGEAC